MRYKFFREKMTEIVAPEWKDPRRAPSADMQDTVFNRQEGKCAVCGESLRHGHIEFHHAERHSQGGKTIPENLAAVHSHCHPRSEKESRKFRERVGV